jgi:hypothetical protein
MIARRRYDDYGAAQSDVRREVGLGRWDPLDTAAEEYVKCAEARYQILCLRI